MEFNSGFKGLKYYIRAPFLTHREQSVRYKYPSVNGVNPRNCMKAITCSGRRVRNFRMLNQTRHTVTTGFKGSTDYFLIFIL